MANEVQSRIDALVKSDRVVLFMKGTRNAPQCGFSATVAGLLDQYVPEYTTVDVLTDPEIRDGIKEYADWPTIPQLYVGGAFVGGCDIVREMDAQGELVAALGDAVRMPDPPDVTLTESAARTFVAALADAEGDEGLRLTIDGTYRHDLSLDPPRPTDIEVTSRGVTVRLDPGSARRARGLVIDYVTEPQPGFKMTNPGAPPQVEDIGPAQARALVDEDRSAKLLDVRTKEEREIATIEGSVHLNRETLSDITALPKDTPLLFLCHHGQRSQQAALHFLEQGFRRVYNVAGGIDAWSTELDPSIPRY
jgi:monothiol glutaredoxin